MTEPTIPTQGYLSTGPSLTNAEIETLITSQGGEHTDKLLFGMRMHLISPNERREFISDITRRPRSGGHQKVKAHINEALTAFREFIKANLTTKTA